MVILTGHCDGDYYQTRERKSRVKKVALLLIDYNYSFILV